MKHHLINTSVMYHFQIEYIPVFIDCNGDFFSIHCCIANGILSVF